MIIGDFESDDRRTGGGEGLAHHRRFRTIPRDVEIIQLGPEMTVAKGAIHAPLAKGIQYLLFGETPNKKGCGQGSQKEAEATVFMKVGRCDSPYGIFPLAAAVGPQKAVPEVPGFSNGDVVRIDGSKAGIIPGLIKDLGVGRGIQENGTKFPAP